MALCDQLLDKSLIAGKGSSQFATNTRKGTIDRRGSVTVLGQSEDAIGKDLFPEGVGGVISDMFAILIESSGCFVIIFGSPEVIISKISIFAPFIIDSINDLFITFILSPIQPVRFQYSTSMSTITTEAATTLLRESYPSLIFHSILNTRSSHIR